MTEQVQWACPNGHTALVDHEPYHEYEPPDFACQECGSEDWERTGEVF